MDIKALKIFVHIIQCKSFSVAAEQLFVTQPTVSKAVTQLEQELGTTLFKKGSAGRKREIELTYTGEQVYMHALKIIEEQKKIYETLDDVKQLKKGKLTLGLPPLGCVLLTSLIALFNRKYPNVELSFLEVGTNGIEQAILAKTVDVGVLLGEVNPLFQAIPIVDSPLCLVSAKNTNWNNKEKISFTDLKNESFLLYHDSFTLNDVIIHAAEQAGFSPHIICKSSQWDFIVKMVELSMGIAILPKIYCDQLNPNKYGIYPLEDQSLRWVLSMAWNTTVPMTAATKVWLEIIHSHQQDIKF